MATFELSDVAPRSAGYAWQRSSRCEHANCVEVARGEGETVLVRNSEHPGLSLTFTAAQWRGFLDFLRSDPSDR